MKQKNNTYVLVTVFFVIVLCVLAYFYLRKSNNPEAKIWVQAKSKEIKKVDGLDEIIKDVKFINNQEEDIITEDFSEDINVSVKIENNTIAIKTQGKSVNVTSIKNPVSVSTFYVGGEDSLFVDVYVLNKDKQLYHIGFASAEFAFDGVKVTLLALPEIESYSTNVRMLDNRENSINFVLAKGVDGKYYTDYEFEDDTEYTLREVANYVEDEVEEEDEKEISYGIYSTKEVNPFKDLDFNSKGMEESDDFKLEFDSQSITYKGSYYEDDDERKQTVTIKVKNVKQVNLFCDETGGHCSEIIYLTADGNLYEVVALEDGYFQKDNDGTYKKSTRLVEKNVNSFALIPIVQVDPSTGGGQYIVFKKNDGKMFIVTDKTYSIDNYKRIWIDGYNNPLYVINKGVKVNKYLQTSDGKNLVAKKLYTFEGNEEDGDGESFMYIYVLNEDDYIYEIEDYTKNKATKFKDKKVKSITERDDDILVTFVDNTTEVIDAYLEYEAK